MSTAGQRPTPGWWAQLRGILVALHVAVVVFMALPAPEGGMNRRTWKDPTVQAEFEAWRSRLEALGVEVEPAELEDAAWSLAQGYMSVRNGVLDPLAPWFRISGTRQSWRMFVAPHTHPAELVVAVREGGTWTEVYRSRDPAKAWRRTQLDHTRTRSAIFRYAWKHYRGHYKRFSEWLAVQAAADFPEADRVRVYWWRTRSRSPEEVRQGVEPEGKVERALEHDLSELRLPELPVGGSP